MELRTLSREGLIDKEKNLRQELLNLKFQKSIGQLENIARISQVTKDIARVETFLREIKNIGDKGKDGKKKKQ